MATASLERVIRSRRVVTPRGIEPASIVLAGGHIAEVAAYRGDDYPCPVDDVGDAVVMPGLVDTHVHVNEPGRTEWEGYASATHAAAAGGITTLVDMPLNSIPATTTRQALDAKRAQASGQCFVDVAFWGGVVPGNRDRLEELIAAGVMGFKCFLCDSGVAEFAAVGESDLRAALPILAEAGPFAGFGALLALLLTAFYLIGMLERRDRTVWRMGWDSMAALAAYAAGVVVLYGLR